LNYNGFFDFWVFTNWGVWSVGWDLEHYLKQTKDASYWAWRSFSLWFAGKTKRKACINSFAIIAMGTETNPVHWIDG
jgi:hypothetical protein